MFSYRRSERGQVVVIVAVALTILVAMAGLIIDGGLALTNRRQVQNAADAAALAGTRVLSLDIKWRATGSDPATRPFANADAAVCDAINNALAYNENGAQEIGQIACSAPGGSPEAVYVNFARTQQSNVGGGIPIWAAGVRVTPTGTSDTLLMRVVGISTMDVAGAGTALTGPVPLPIGALLPMVVQNPLGPFVPDKQYSIRTESPGECDVAAAPVDTMLAQDATQGIVLAMATQPSATDKAPLAAAPTTPVASPAATTFQASITVTLTAQSGAAIWYTTDGSQPSKNKGTLYTGPLTFTKTTTLQAVAVGSTGPASSVGSFTYTQIDPPGAVTANPVTGTSFATSITVSLTAPTSGSTIYYTTNGTTPTASSSVYSGALTFTNSTQLNAVAIKSGVASAMASFSYPKDDETFPPLANHPSGTTFESGITIQLTSATPGATIHYTTNGTEPTDTSPVYDSSYGIVLTQSATIRAYAVADGLTDSVKTSYSYELVGASCPDLSAGNFGWVDFNGGSSGNNDLKNWIQNPGTAPTSWYTRVCTGLTDVNCRDEHDPTDPSDDHWRLTGTSGHRSVSLSMACNQYIGQEVFVPIWDRFETIKKNSNGHNAVFHLIGFGVFRVDGVIDNKGNGDPSSDACGEGLNFGGKANDKGLVGTYVSSLIGSQVTPCIASTDGTNPCQNLNTSEMGINLAD